MSGYREINKEVEVRDRIAELWGLAEYYENLADSYLERGNDFHSNNAYNILQRLFADINSLEAGLEDLGKEV